MLHGQGTLSGVFKFRTVLVMKLICPFAYSTALMFAQIEGKAWIYLPMKLIFLLIALARLKAVTKVYKWLFCPLLTISQSKQKGQFHGNTLDEAVQVNFFLSFGP